MPEPGAKKDDLITAIDAHMVDGALVPVPYSGVLDGKLSPNVLIENKPAATVGSTATNKPAHVPPPGKTFDTPPTNQAVIVGGAARVLINWREAARNYDPAETCNDPDDLPVGTVVADCTVLIGDD